MVNAGINDVYRDMLLGHSKQGMDKHYLHVKPEIFSPAMNDYTHWLDDQIKTAQQQNVDQAVDQN